MSRRYLAVSASPSTTETKFCGKTLQINSLSTEDVFGANSDGFIITVLPEPTAPIRGVSDNWNG